MNMAVVTKFISRTGLKLRKHLPAIMTAAGIIAGGTCVVTACKQTLKVHEEIKPNLESIAQKRKEGAQKADIRKEYISIAGKAMKAYAVPAAFGAASVALTVGGHKVLTKENAALASAYIALDKSFKAYKEKMPLPQTISSEETKENDDFAEIEPFVPEDNGLISPYARMFDCTNWNYAHNSPALTINFIRSVEKWVNDQLHSKGYMFLNDVYEQLGMERSEAGQYMGWVDNGELGNSHISFGIDWENSPSVKAFLHGKINCLMLDFNVDGPIIHMFSKY